MLLIIMRIVNNSFNHHTIPPKPPPNPPPKPPPKPPPNPPPNSCPGPPNLPKPPLLVFKEGFPRGLPNSSKP